VESDDHAELRRPDPWIAEQILGALGSVRTVVSLAPGAGAYEPDGARVVAVEPSARSPGAVRAGVDRIVVANAEALPFGDRTFDAALSVLSLHHCIEPEAALDELARVADRVVVLTWDPRAAGRWWWLGEYFTGLDEVDEAKFPPVQTLRSRLSPCRVQRVSIPHDCRDGFLGAYWRRPHAYLDERVRAAISSFSDPRIGDVHEGVTRLAGDLANGRWLARWGALLAMERCDLGYRLLVTPSRRQLGPARI
jgi:SAM-dependent methyltransferase